MFTTQRHKWIINRVKGPKVLDIGFAAVGARDDTVHRQITAIPRVFVVGIDKDVVRVNQLSEPNSLVGDLFNLPFKANTFDEIVIGEVLEHLADIDRAISETVRVAKSGGGIIVTTPSPYGFFRWLRNWVLTSEPGSKANVSYYLGAPDHQVFWEPLSLIKHFDRHGADCVEVTTRNISLPYLPDSFRNPPLNFWPLDRLGTYGCYDFRKR